MSAIIPDRNRLARAFEVIAPAIRDASTRNPIQKSAKAPAAKAETASAKAGRAKGKAGAPAGATLGVDGDPTADRKPSMQTILEGPQPSPRPSIAHPKEVPVGHSSHEHQPKPKGGASMSAAKAAAAAKAQSDPSTGDASPVREAKAPKAGGTKSSALAPRAHPPASDSRQVAPKERSADRDEVPSSPAMSP